MDGASTQMWLCTDQRSKYPVWNLEFCPAYSWWKKQFPLTVFEYECLRNFCIWASRILPWPETLQLLCCVPPWVQHVWSSCIIPHYQGRERGQGCDNLEIIICKGTSEKWIQGNSAFCRCFVTIQTMTMKVSTSKDQVRIKYATPWQFRLRNLSKSNHFRMREWIILWLTWNSLIW